ncbi:hypothetical protein V6N12_013593 [Hibiscus sabdariffa]|uniref:Uncharacterized protein n=1 Tax=Hibiscus sabdariffa TaxID=183260 RepID=A0ABR2C9U2_9ROSI
MEEMGFGESVNLTLAITDDLLVFCEASESQVVAVKRVLRVFELASDFQSWASAIGCSMGSFPSNYLGLLLRARRNSVSLWEPVLKKMSSKLASWKSQILSFGRRIILVRSVLASLPIFFMSLFQNAFVCYKTPHEYGLKLLVGWDCGLKTYTLD